MSIETHLVGLTVALPLLFGVTLVCVARRRGGLIDPEPIWAFIAATEGCLALLFGAQAHSTDMTTGHVPILSQLTATLLLALTGGTVVFAIIVYVEHRRTGAALKAMEEGGNED